jgi:hypothetical protein
VVLKNSNRRLDRTLIAPVAVAFLTSVIGACVVGCADRRAQDRFRWGEILASIVQAKQAGGESVHLDLVRVMPFGWEKFYVFPPYTPIEDIDRALGFKWGQAKKTRINERDDITLLVFVMGKTVYEYIEQPRSEGDFSRLEPSRPYSPREGYFEVLEDKQDGRAQFYFVEAQRYE